MKLKLNYFAAIISAIIGGMAIVAGGKVLLGIDPGYYVINWVPVYNYTVGLLSVFITAILIWRGSKLALPLAIGTISAHGIVMVILQTVFWEVVASESTKAMTMRLAAWAIILALLVIQRARNTARQKSTRKVAVKQEERSSTLA